MLLGSHRLPKRCFLALTTSIFSEFKNFHQYFCSPALRAIAPKCVYFELKLVPSMITKNQKKKNGDIIIWVCSVSFFFSQGPTSHMLNIHFSFTHSTIYQPQFHILKRTPPPPPISPIFHSLSIKLKTNKNKQTNKYDSRIQSSSECACFCLQYILCVCVQQV